MGYSVSMSEWLTPSEAAKYMRVHPTSVYAWLKSGRLHGVRAGKWWRISTDEVDDFMKRCARERS